MYKEIYKTTDGRNVNIYKPSNSKEQKWIAENFPYDFDDDWLETNYNNDYTAYTEYEEKLLAKFKLTVSTELDNSDDWE